MPQDTTPTTAQLQYLDDLERKTDRRFQRPPATRAEASERIRLLQKAARSARTPADPGAAPSQAQLNYIGELARSRGLRFGTPRTRAAAARQIAALKAVPTGRYERLRERDIRTRQPTISAVPISDDEVEGYGALARWSTTDAAN